MSTTCPPIRWSRSRASSRTASRGACRSGALPEPVAALVRHELAIQDAAVEAAVEGSRDLAMRALLLDPVVTDVHAAERFLDAILAAHRAYLPRFWS